MGLAKRANERKGKDIGKENENREVERNVRVILFL